mmetsp:Transcript_63681/g.154006  ORF Transcript_63681/g.154006 Transcript_63681/m.154006 type:complete len:215 (+) Transcript_63681:168-812(+)
MAQPSNRCPIAACSECQQKFSLLLVHLVHDGPEVADNRCVFVKAVFVDCVGFQVLEVEHGAATHQELQLCRAKQLQNLTAAELVEPTGKRRVLGRDRVNHEVLHVEVDPLLAILVCDWDVGAPGLELNGPHGTEELLNDFEHEAHVFLDIALVLHHRTHALRNVREYLFDVAQLHGEVQELPIHGSRKVHVEDHIIVDSQAQQCAHQLELDAGL